MPGMHELRKRLRSVQSVEKLTEAMYTASTAKYSKILRLRGRAAPCAQACENMLREVGGDFVPDREVVRHRDLLVVLGSNRGMCGSFNSELMRRFDDALDQTAEPPLVIACSAMAAIHLRARKLAFEELRLPDVPDYAQVRTLTRRLKELYLSGEAARVFIIYQKLENLMVQTPTVCQFLPAPAVTASGEEAVSPLFLPERSVIGSRLAELRLQAVMYELALQNAAGAQAATMMAMRSAADSARESVGKLERTINRRRQAEVTASVIETSSGSAMQGEF